VWWREKILTGVSRIPAIPISMQEWVCLFVLNDEDEAYLNRRSSLRGATTLSSRFLASSPRNREEELENCARARFSTSRPARSTSYPLKFKPRTSLGPQRRRSTPTRWIRRSRGGARSPTPRNSDAVIMSWIKGHCVINPRRLAPFLELRSVRSGCHDSLRRFN